jgi:type II secretory pathway pseudopilin PulG
MPHPAAAFRENRADSPAISLSSRTNLRKGSAAYTLMEVLFALAVLAFTSVVITQSMLQLNRRAAVTRLLNAAKAEAISRIQEVSQCSYNPTASPAVIPTILNVGTTTTAVELGSTQTGLGSVPGTATWTVTSLSSTTNILSIKCTVSCTYLNRNLSYALFTYKSPD